MTNATTIGARLHGVVMHVITKGMHNDVTACGRVVIPGKGEGMRVCRTCVRISPDARRINDRMRKAERETRMRESNSSEMAEEFISWEFQLNAEELEMTREKIEKINTRCANRGIPGGLNVEWREEIKKEKNSLGVEIETISYPTKITGISPKLPNWEFMATLDYDQHAGLIVRAYPGMPAIDRAELRQGWCDHCQTDRYRKTTYVMRNTQTHEQVQVGSSCIKDFTGWIALPYTFDRMAKDVEEFEGGFGGPRDVTVLTALAVSWAVVKEYGFVRSNEQGATKGMVLDVIDPPKANKGNADYLAELREIAKHSEEMYSRAEELREFILNDESFPLSDRSDYPANMKAVVRPERVSFRNMGILASAPQAWARFLEKSFIKEKESMPVSQWFGNMQDKWELSLTLKAVKYVSTVYGESTLHTFADASGNVFKWFASSADLTDDGAIGDTFRVVATIKKHEDWNSIQSTALTRVKVIGDEMAEPVLIPVPNANREMLYKSLQVDPKTVFMVAGEYLKIRKDKTVAYAVKRTDTGWEYAPGAIHSIIAEYALTADQAAQFGHDYAHCVFCSKALTDERSTTVGYGPDCAERVGLPWGG